MIQPGQTLYNPVTKEDDVPAARPRPAATTS